MAHHGGRTVPRAHRPRAPTMSVQAPQPHQHPPLTAPLAPLRPTPTIQQSSTQQPPPTIHNLQQQQQQALLSPVTLQAPRPDAERATNEYVETPFRAATQTILSAAAADKTPGPPVSRNERPSRLPLTASTHQHHQHHHQQLHQLPHHQQLHHHHHGVSASVTVTKQPVAFTKEHPAAIAAAAAAAAASAASECASSGNIICSECGLCRCESCRAPRALPSRWVCDNSCLCSADAVIDYASCLCCVKGLYYHCSDTDAGATCADDPCSCGPHRRMARWACLGALAVLLPCLLCYWPLRGCQRGVEAAYARHTRAGCRCRPHQTTPEKRLLDSSPEY